MQFSHLVLSTLVAVAAAAPTTPSMIVKDARSAVDTLGSLSDYFNLLAVKVKSAKTSDVAPVCDLSKARMPDAPELLPPHGQGLTLRHVAVGRGTQNYTCDTGKPSSAPVAVGAVATLFNASCVAALYPDLLEKIPGMAVHFSLDQAQKLGPSNLAVSGHHWFDGKTPYFDLRNDGQDYGQAPCEKNSSSAAPSTAGVGQLGEAAVPWLKLTTIDGATGGIKEVYRLTTAGGSAPATCQGMPEKFEVQYATVYWFWSN